MRTGVIIDPVAIQQHNTNDGSGGICLLCSGSHSVRYDLGCGGGIDICFSRGCSVSLSFDRCPGVSSSGATGISPGPISLLCTTDISLCPGICGRSLGIFCGGIQAQYASP